MGESILLDLDDGVARVTLNRPDRLNAMDLDMAEHWRDAARFLAAARDVSAVILDASGPAFCAGGDVIAMATAGLDGAAVTRTASVIHEGIVTLAELPVPIVAAVQGAVAGGGLGLMLTADIVVAADSAVFVSRYADVGLTPDLGVSTLLAAAVGQRRALQLLLTDRSLTAPEALDWGLVAEVVDREDLPERALSIARHWRDGASAAFGEAKRLVRVGAGRSFSDSLDDEADTIGRAFDGADSRQRVAAFAAASAARAKTKERDR